MKNQSGEKLYNDFRPETNSLLRRLKKAGFQIDGGNNGEDKIESPNKIGAKTFLAELIATDETYLYVSKNGSKFSLWLVLGNSPGEIVSDIRYSSKDEESETLKELNDLTTAHYESWEDRKQPTLTQTQYYKLIGLPMPDTTTPFPKAPWLGV